MILVCRAERGEAHNAFPTLRSPLSGTFLQTLPDLVTPLKGHSTLRSPLSGTFLQTLPDLVTPLKRHSISAQLSSDAVSTFRKVRVLI